MRWWKWWRRWDEWNWWAEAHPTVYPTPYAPAYVSTLQLLPNLCIYPTQRLIHYLATCLTIRPPLQNAEPVSGGVLGLPVRNLAVGAVVGFELSGDELELLEEDMALCADALRAQVVKFATQAV